MNNDSLKNREDRIQTDNELIETLLRHGANLQNEYLVDFLFAGDDDNLNRIEPILLKRGYVKNQEGSISGRLLVQDKIKLDSMKSHIITESLESLADEFGVKFDGWGTEV